ncbi:MAG: presenilin family intramembrane aspartyl protease [Candidatus Bathyarchaeota archaeon]|nr:presenilin family intramembrane aspartyl protease [Candidatus Bathyarchaeota archaeon]
MTEKFSAQIVYLFPVLASLLFGLCCAYLLIAQPLPPMNVAPFPEENASAPLGNAFYFVVLIALSATVFYILLKRKSRKLIFALIALALTTASLLLSIIYLSAIFAYKPDLEFLVLPLSILVTTIFDLAIFRLGNKARNLAVVFLGGGLGVFFSASIPFLSAVMILVFLAIYDVFAVYYGPVGKIAHSGLDQLHGLSYSFKDVQMGLGDLVFYSMLVGSILFEFQPTLLPCLVAIIGITVGSFLTLIMLETKGIFPGLPFPIVFGLAGGILSSLMAW